MEPTAVQTPSAASSPTPASTVSTTSPSATAGAAKTLFETALHSVVVGFAIGLGFILAQKLTKKNVVVQGQGQSQGGAQINFSGGGNYAPKNHQRRNFAQPHPPRFQYSGHDPRMSARGYMSYDGNAPKRDLVADRINQVMAENNW